MAVTNLAIRPAERRIISEKDLQRRFTRQTRKYLRRLHVAYKQVARGYTAKAIHDLRVATRRLQTLLDVAALSKPSKSIAQLRKPLKRLRHALGRRRDIDVLLSKLRERVRTATSSRRRQLWQLAIRELRQEAKQAARETHKELKAIAERKLERRIRKVIHDQLRKAAPWPELGSAIPQVQQKWSAAINSAAASKDSRHFHDVRIKTKTLRYTIEFLSQLCKTESASDIIEWLKGIQDELGEWHDQVELCRRVTLVLSEDADSQANQTATAIIETLRARTQAENDYARSMTISLQNTIKQKNALRSVVEINQFLN